MVMTYLFRTLMISIWVFSTSCKKNDYEAWRHVELSPLDDSQTITIITKENKRYIMNGKHKNIPKDNYLLLDLSRVDQLGDGISICWNEDGYKWKLACSYAKIVKNDLDSASFKYHQPLGKYGQPVADGYTEENCGGILIRENRAPRGNVKVAYIVE